MGAGEYEAESGSGEVHLGWLVPGTVVCLGAGPMRMRLTEAEARDLAQRLVSMLRRPAVQQAQCGCEPPPENDVDVAVAAARRQFSDFGGRREMCPYHATVPVPCFVCDTAAGGSDGRGPG